MKMKKVCIIIPTLNEEEFIGDLIDSLNKNTYSNKEIIVVDDGSEDKTIEIAREKGAKILINNPGRRGPAFGWNRAAGETDAEIICILGADFLITDEHFLEEGLKAFDDKTVAVHTWYKTKQCTFIEKVVTQKEGMSMEPRFYNRKYFLELGGFPEIGFGEDVIMNEKLKEFSEKKGLKIKKIKTAYFSGHGVHSIKEMYRQALWYGKTTPMFLSHFKGKILLKRFLNVYLRPIYFISMLLSFLGFLNYYFFIFTIPFALITLKIITSAVKEKNYYGLFKIFTYLLFGVGMVYGTLIYFLGKKNAGF